MTFDEWFAKEFGDKREQLGRVVPELMRAAYDAAALKTIEDALLTISEPVGMACCGQPADDHGYICCGNGEPDFRTMDEVEKVLEGWRDNLIGATKESV